MKSFMEALATNEKNSTYKPLLKLKAEVFQLGNWSMPIIIIITIIIYVIISIISIANDSFD